LITHIELTVIVLVFVSWGGATPEFIKIPFMIYEGEILGGNQAARKMSIMERLHLRFYPERMLH